MHSEIYSLTSRLTDGGRVRLAPILHAVTVAARFRGFTILAPRIARVGRVAKLDRFHRPGPVELRRVALPQRPAMPKITGGVYFYAVAKGHQPGLYHAW